MADHYPSGLGHPPSGADGAPPLPHYLEEPPPSRRVDGLAYAVDEPERAPVVPLDEVFAELHLHPRRRGCRVEDRDAVPLYHLPPPVGLRMVERTFVDDRRRAFY